MEIVQWILTHGSEVELTISWYDTNIEFTMYTRSNRRSCRYTYDYHEIRYYTDKTIILILDLMYDELLKENING